MRNTRAPSISAFEFILLEEFQHLEADGLPIATSMAAAFCARVMVAAVLKTVFSGTVFGNDATVVMPLFTAVMISVRRMPKRDGSLSRTVISPRAMRGR